MTPAHNGFLEKIASQLSIKKDETETEQEWQCRVIYSAAGYSSLASLWDFNEEESVSDRPGISIVHYKRTFSQKLSAFLALYPDAQKIFSVSPSEIVEELYEIGLATGLFYHKSNRLFPAAYACGEGIEFTFERGRAAGVVGPVSGLGAYTKRRAKETDKTIAELYCLSQNTFSSWFSTFEKGCRFEPIRWPNDVEFLRLTPPFKQGYWQKNIERDNKISLARYGSQGMRIYYLYKSEGQRVLACQLPLWLSEEGRWLQVATALLMRYCELPPIKVQKGDQIASLELGYLLPPAEEAFLNLYSWPESYYIAKKRWQRKMAMPVYREIKPIFEKMGYQFLGG